MEHTKLIASEGMILTNGELYGREVFVGTGDKAENWYEITETEYAKILAAQVAELEEMI